ncbi:MAG: peptidylprolyl isomerase [Zavarzinella sp.]
MKPMSYITIAIFIFLSSFGCGDNSSSPTAESSTTSAAAQSVPDSQPDFSRDTLSTVPNGQRLPVDSTVAGKSTAKVRQKVEELWPTIQLKNEKGEWLNPVVTLETSLGDIELALQPEWAPNHVRNFIALVEAGYYDGLKFDRVVRHQVQDEQGKMHPLEMIRAGCPTATGDPGIGHLGYFMTPEIRPDLKHETGTVGWWHDEDPTSGGVRFYIALAPSPLLDSQYSIVGKVQNGLKVAQEIGLGKILPLEFDPTAEQPEQPIIIKRATWKSTPPKVGQ